MTAGKPGGKEEGEPGTVDHIGLGGLQVSAVAAALAPQPSTPGGGPWGPQLTAQLSAVLPSALAVAQSRASLEDSDSLAS